MTLSYSSLTLHELTISSVGYLSPLFDDVFSEEMCYEKQLYCFG
jgi:hypothetical protein